MKLLKFMYEKKKGGLSVRQPGGIQGVIVGKKAVVEACIPVNRDVPDGRTAVGAPYRGVIVWAG